MTKRLVARAEQELLVDPPAQQRRHRQARDGEHGDERHRDERERRAVPEHDGEEHEQERRVEQQARGRAGQELADRLYALQARDQGAGGPGLEIARRQAQQVLERAHAEHRVDAVAGVQHQVLARVAQRRAEQHEDRERGQDDDQRARRMVHDDLVDDDLGAQRHRQRDRLQRERGRQHFAPDRLVAQQLGNEPAQAERPVGERALARARLWRRGGHHDLGRIAHREFEQRLLARPRLALGDERRPLVRGEHQREPRARAFAPDRQHRQERMPQIARRNGSLGHPQAERGGGVEQRGDRDGRRALLQHEARIERHALHPAQARKRPDEISRIDRRVQLQRQDVPP